MTGPTVAVIGTGRMGPGIAVAFAVGGCGTLVIGRGAAQLRRAQAAFQVALAALVEHGLLTAEAGQAAASRLQPTTEAASLGRADVVVEATPEVLQDKQALFGNLERLARPDAILASNTSGLPITCIAARTRTAHRVVGMKFVNPAHLVPLVEVVKGDATAPEIVTQACVLLRQIGKRPVAVMRDVPGFLNNRIQQAMRREAISLVARGIASAEDVDRIAGEWQMPAISVEPGFAPQPMRANDRRLYPIYARCADRGLTVILTLSLMTGPDVSYCLPVDVDQVAHDFPGLRLVIAHACWPWVQPMVGVAFRRTNVYLSPDIYAINLPGRDDFALAARTYLQDRFLFASGYPFAPVGGAVQAYRAMGFSGEIAEKIFRRNAAALLRLSDP